MLTRPRKHQEQILSVIENKKYFGLFWEMGTGKTWIGCYLIDTLFDDEHKKFLIICPTSVIDTWINEFKKHTDIDPAFIVPVTGSRQQRIVKLNSDANIFIINYEGLRVVSSELMNMEFEVKIADESHRIKSHKAQQTKIAVAIPAKRRFILSGTPILKDYRDVFTQWKFMDDGKLFGYNFYAFQRQYFYDANAQRYRGMFSDYKLKPGMDKILNKKMAVTSHRLEKKDCTSLPPKVFKTLYCELTGEQKRIYEEIKEDCIAFIDKKGEQTITTQQAFVKILRLNQVTSGYVKPDGSEKEITFKENPKMKLLTETVEEILENPNIKLIIWAHFRHDIETIYKTMNEKYGAVRIHGDIPQADRGDLIKKFQTDKKCRVFVGQPHSAGIGVTLTAASYALYYSYSFSLEDRLQSMDRCHRIGSEVHDQIVYIDLIMKNTIDEVILKAVDKKDQLAAAVMNYIKDHNA